MITYLWFFSSSYPTQEPLILIKTLPSMKTSITTKTQFCCFVLMSLEEKEKKAKKKKKDVI